MSDQNAELPRYSGPATIIRYAIYLHRGIIPDADLREDFPSGSVLVTSSAERAILEGMPPADHRPPIASFIGGTSPQSWNADAAIAKLKGRLRSGGAVLTCP